MQSELKPCPFCGSDRLMVLPPTCDRNTPYSAADRAYPVVRCSDCYTDVPGKDFDASSKSAVEAWNRRSLTAALSEKQAAEVKTKPLEWEGELGTEYAASILGLYSVWEGHYRPPGAHGGIQADNPKQAAQDHLERIIRSALVDVPAVESETNELAAYWGHMAAVFSDLDITIPRLGGEQRKKLAEKAFETAKALYTHPPLREGEDSAEVERLRRESEILRGVFNDVLDWAERRCPCHNEEPNPCPLCGASVENLEACKSAENTLPRGLLIDLRIARSLIAASATTVNGAADHG